MVRNTLPYIILCTPRVLWTDKKLKTIYVLIPNFFPLCGCTINNRLFTNLFLMALFCLRVGQTYALIVFTANPSMARMQPFVFPWEWTLNPLANSASAALSLIGKPISKSESIASIVGHSTPRSLKKADLEIPHAKQRSKLLFPANHRNVTANPLALIASVSSRLISGDSCCTRSKNVSMSNLNILLNIVSGNRSISAIANPRFRRK